jgi:hypothetical protein
MPPPPEPDQPFFTYGLLQPGQLAHAQVASFLTGQGEPATISGALSVRDGLPLLLPVRAGRVLGSVLRFRAESVNDEWLAICAFEPKSQYKWGTTEAETESGVVGANVLIGRSPGKGGVEFDVPPSRWSAAEDPVFTHGLDVVLALVRDAVPGGIEIGPEGGRHWKEFFQLQAAYLLLWSAVERYTALRFGPGLDPSDRIRRLDQEDHFRSAVRGAGAESATVFDVRNSIRAEWTIMA